MKYSKLFNHQPIKKIVIFMMLYGILLILYSVNVIDIIALFLVLLVGPVLQIKDIIQETFIINNIDEKDMIKITGLKNSLVQVSFLFSILIVGYITDHIEIQYIYTISGIITCIIAVVFSKFSKIKKLHI